MLLNSEQILELINDFFDRSYGSLDEISRNDLLKMLAALIMAINARVE